MSRQAIIKLEENSTTAGEVINLIEVSTDTAIGFTLPLDELMWDCGQYPVTIGDRWEDGIWSRDGQELVPIPTNEQKIIELESQFAALAEQITDTQLALCEVYELME